MFTNHDPKKVSMKSTIKIALISLLTLGIGATANAQKKAAPKKPAAAAKLQEAGE